MKDLGRCLNPTSVAVVGGREVERVIIQCRKTGFGGDIYVVNPRRERLAGLPCLPNIESLPIVPDVAFVAIPAEPTIEAVRLLAEMDAGGVVCYASGFREVGASDLHERLIAAAGDMPLIGPNCYGYVNAMNGAALWPDQHGMRRCDRGVAIFSASGNIGVNMTMQQRGLPLALMISTGNQATVGVEELLDAMLVDDRITAVGLLIEGLRDLPKFIQVASRAVEVGKPVVVLKNGRSSVGARITMSHTATLAGESGLYDALFTRLGVAQVEDLETFLETLKLLSICGPLRANNIASMSCSGGEASMIADLAESRNLHFPPLTRDHKFAVQETLNEYVSVDNPLDYHTFIWGDGNALQATFTAMVRGGFDLTILVLDYPCTNDCDPEEWLEAGRAFARACRVAGHPGCVVVSLMENVTSEIIEELAGYGIPVLMGIPQALKAIEAGAMVGKAVGPPPNLTVPRPLKGEGTALLSIGEAASKRLLHDAGFCVPDGDIAGDVDTAEQMAGKIGYPVAIKLADPNIAHKTEAGGVRLNVSNGKGVRDAVTELLIKGDQVLIESMVVGGQVELLLGVANDPQFGHYYIIGAGGTLVELLADRAVLLPPLSGPIVQDALQSLKIAPLLAGYRGNSPADVDAVVQTMLLLEQFVDQNQDNLLEVDINPLIVHPQGEGATVADALLVFGDKCQ